LVSGSESESELESDLEEEALEGTDLVFFFFDLLDAEDEETLDSEDEESLESEDDAMCRLQKSGQARQNETHSPSRNQNQSWRSSNSSLNSNLRKINCDMFLSIAIGSN
jgi:hypothetical protein